MTSDLHDRRARRRRIDAEALGTAHDLRDSASMSSPETYPVIVTRSYVGDTTPLPRARRHAFLTHLVRVTREAFAQPARHEPNGAVDTPAAPLFAHACATCGGFCCSHGGDRAFVAADTIRRYVASHPTTRASDVVRAYAAHLDRSTHTGSCVFHHRDGCALPTDMRSDTCNRYYCGALAELQRANTPRAFVAAADREGAIVAAAFTDGEEITPVTRAER